ncbi:carboxymuconolactone decarboxylase family protein [Saccharothrix luteola]|uniref:carboxymuconolactone decarboxylase family protein n=1 Tax=Saccharothrix luteola TaxID=2893018 RepID=UPI001E4BFB84|nr:carboxymuconolactone decarboxylase family protein [Saccharothrix luteola]MCC8242734.1 carboxymuconolactone decarboxylase family protein [Saccharothrix luteola]
MTAENPLEARHRNQPGRYERGLETANELAGHEAVQGFLDDLGAVSGSTARLVIETVFGTLHHEPGLDHRERELVTLTALAVLGDTEKELKLHLAIAHRIGVPPASVVALFAHISAYAGFPRALNALAVAKAFYTDQGLLQHEDQ